MPISKEVWSIVWELFKALGGVVFIIGVLRGFFASIKKTLGEEDTIEKALRDIGSGFFFYLMTLPLVYAIWVVCSYLSDKASAFIEW